MTNDYNYDTSKIYELDDAVDIPISAEPLSPNIKIIENKGKKSTLVSKITDMLPELRSTSRQANDLFLVNGKKLANELRLPSTYIKLLMFTNTAWYRDLTTRAFGTAGTDIQFSSIRTAQEADAFRKTYRRKKLNQDILGETQLDGKTYRITKGAYEKANEWLTSGNGKELTGKFIIKETEKNVFLLHNFEAHTPLGVSSESAQFQGVIDLFQNVHYHPHDITEPSTQDFDVSGKGHKFVMTDNGLSVYKRTQIPGFNSYDEYSVIVGNRKGVNEVLPWQDIVSGGYHKDPFSVERLSAHSLSYSLNDNIQQYNSKIWDTEKTILEKHSSFEQLIEEYKQLNVMRPFYNSLDEYHSVHGSDITRVISGLSTAPLDVQEHYLSNEKSLNNKKTQSNTDNYEHKTQSEVIESAHINTGMSAIIGKNQSEKPVGPITEEPKKRLTTELNIEDAKKNTQALLETLSDSNDHGIWDAMTNEAEIDELFKQKIKEAIPLKKKWKELEQNGAPTEEIIEAANAYYEVYQDISDAPDSVHNRHKQKAEESIREKFPTAPKNKRGERLGEFKEEIIAEQYAEYVGRRNVPDEHGKTHTIYDVFEELVKRERSTSTETKTTEFELNEKFNPLPEGKNLWELSRDEVLGLSKVDTTTLGISDLWPHKMSVEDAISRGENVSEHVIKQYADLAPSKLSLADYTESIRKGDTAKISVNLRQSEKSVWMMSVAEALATDTPIPDHVRQFVNEEMPEINLKADQLKRVRQKTKTNLTSEVVESVSTHPSTTKPTREAKLSETPLESTQKATDEALDKIKEIRNKNNKPEAPQQSTDARPTYVEPSKPSGKAPGSGKTEGKATVKEGKDFLGKYGTAIGLGILAISAIAALKNRDDDSSIREEGAEENNPGGLHHRAKEALHRFHKYRGGSFKRSSYDSDSNRSHAVVGAIAGATAFGIKGQELFSNLAKRENILKGNNQALFSKAFNSAETAWGIATGVSKITRSNNAQDRVSGVADIVNAAFVPSAANRIVEAVAGKTKAGVGIEMAKLGVQFGLAGATSYMARHLGMAIDKKGNKGYSNPTMEYKPTPDQNTDAIAAHDSPGDFAMSMVTRDLPMARKEVDKKLHHLINNGYAY